MVVHPLRKAVEVKGSTEFGRAELIGILSFRLGLFSPAEAKARVEKWIREGLLVEKEGKLFVTGDVESKKTPEDVFEEIITKKPSANLLPGQYDEDEMGVDYQTLDAILYAMELNTPHGEIPRILGVDERIVNRVMDLYRRSRHKRVLLYIPKIGIRTINTDWRE